MLYGVTAYVIWGAFPLYFGLIAIVSPYEVVPWRVITTLLFSSLLVTITRRWSQIRTILRTPKLLGWFALSSILLYANWQIFIVGVMTERVLETALGYFINPLFTILIGVVVRKEKLTRLQWIAVTTAGIGVLITALVYGQIPWIALGLAVSFGLYGAVHKQTGDVDGLTGLTIETIVSVPIGIAQMLLIASMTGITAFAHGPGIAVLVLVSGLVTAVPLILFGESARRLPLSYLGFIQFLTPILSFLYGYLIAHEDLSVGRLIGFIAVWIAVIILVIDMVRQVRAAPDPEMVELNTGPIPLD